MFKTSSTLKCCSVLAFDFTTLTHLYFFVAQAKTVETLSHLFIVLSFKKLLAKFSTVLQLSLQFFDQTDLIHTEFIVCGKNSVPLHKKKSYFSFRFTSFLLHPPLSPSPILKDKMSICCGMGW